MNLEFNSDTHDDDVTDFNKFKAEKFTTNTKLNINNGTLLFALSNKIIIEISNEFFSKKIIPSFEKISMVEFFCENSYVCLKASS